MTDPSVLLVLFFAGAALFLVGLVGVARHDRQVNAARDEISRGRINDAELMRVARAVGVSRDR